MGGATLFRAYRARAGARVGAGAVRAPDCPRPRPRARGGAHRRLGGRLGAKVGHGSYLLSGCGGPRLSRAHLSCAPGLHPERNTPGMIQVRGKRDAQSRRTPRKSGPRLTVSGFMFAFYTCIVSSELQAPVRKFFPSSGLTARIEWEKILKYGFVSSQPRLPPRTGGAAPPPSREQAGRFAAAGDRVE